MRISLVVVGKAKALAPVIREYEARAARYWRLEVHEVPQTRGRVAAGVRRGEAARIRALLRPGYQTVALTRCGDRWSSVDLARRLEGMTLRAERGVHFVIGGAFGLEEGFKRECRFSLSLSALTLPHDFARLVLAEQLYRAGTILRNEPYHKGPK